MLLCLYHFEPIYGQSKPLVHIPAIIVLVLIAYNPFTFPGAPAVMISSVQIMHLVVGGAAIYFLTRS